MQHFQSCGASSGLARQNDSIISCTTFERRDHAVPLLFDQLPLALHFGAKRLGDVDIKPDKRAVRFLG